MAAHALRGSAVNLAAFTLASICQELEQAAGGPGPLSDLAGAIARLAAEEERLRHELLAASER